MNSIEIIDRKNQLVKENSDIISNAKAEVRELTAEESAKFDANQLEINSLDAELEAIENELNTNKNKNINVNKMDKNFVFNKEVIIEKMLKGDQTAFPLKNAYQITGVSGEGEDLVSTNIWDVWEPLRAKTVLAQAGVQFITGLKDNQQIPLFSDGNVFFVDETEEASVGSGSFTSVSLTPHRISGVYPVSLQFMQQTGVDVHNVIMNGIAHSLELAIQNALLDATAASTKRPAGLRYGKTEVEVANYADICDAEATLEEANVEGIKWVISPSLKAELKHTIKGTNNSGFVFENNEVDGYQALMSSAVPQGKALVGDFSQVVVGLWGDPMIEVVRDTTSLASGKFNIILNAFWDAKLVRPQALEVISLAE